MNSFKPVTPAYGSFSLETAYFSSYSGRMYIGSASATRRGPRLGRAYPIASVLVTSNLEIMVSVVPNSLSKPNSFLSCFL